ncbi:MAG: 3-dehydroquinate synthase [Hyphomicrobiaceae bacterium]|nr:3-dehydroquinate synthase [Hyphomicrobiaceae bacterium]
MPIDSFDCVRVELGCRGYDVLIGAGLLAITEQLISDRLGCETKAFIVTDTNVAQHYLETIAQPLIKSGRLRGTLTLPAGELSKSFSVLETVCSKILSADIERGDCVIALGGGVIGDIAGFSSAIVRRGLRYVQIPTSLLAQVDSSVGGKTGINTIHGKNLIGAFYQPHLVLADINTLKTLPERQVSAGYAEVVKYGFLGDSQFYNWLDANLTSIIELDHHALQHAVKRSVEIKAEIVAADEKEHGDRALLNFGHTFGHALETWARYSDVLFHGEAVSIGSCLAFKLSEELKYCPSHTTARISAHLKRARLPTEIAEIRGGIQPDAATLVHLMKQDKKIRDGQLTLIMARDIGQTFVTQEIQHADLVNFLIRQI